MKFRPPMVSIATKVRCNAVLRIDQGAIVATKGTSSATAASERCRIGPLQVRKRKIARSGGSNHTTLRVKAAKPNKQPAASKRLAVRRLIATTTAQQDAINRNVKSTSVSSRAL